MSCCQQHYDSYSLTIFNKVLKLENALKTNLDLSFAEISILVTLNQLGEQKMGELVQNVELPMSTATGVVDKLTTKGMVIRERKAEDKRIMLLKITDKGQGILRQAALLLKSVNIGQVESSWEIKKESRENRQSILRSEINIEWD